MLGFQYAIFTCYFLPWAASIDFDLWRLSTYPLKERQREKACKYDSQFKVAWLVAILCSKLMALNFGRGSEKVS